MNRNDFLNMIEDTIQADRQMIGEVYELIDIFPYFQSAHMLLLKGLQNNADVKFENQLRNSAIHIADRKVLYYLLKTKPSDRAEPDDVKLESVSSAEQLYDSQQTVIESAKNSEQLISKIEKSSGETRTDHPESINHITGHSILLSSEMENEVSKGVMLLMDQDLTPDEDKVFYMDPGFSVPEYNDLLELDLDANMAIVFDEDTISQEQKGSDERNSKTLSPSELINKFIIANPRIEPIREVPRIPVADISKPFADIEGGLVTETLARIYINQGYYSKAIDIYEKLTLKFPEKSSYFASQIEIVEEYLKK
jgi:hypothetical protein